MSCKELLDWYTTIYTSVKCCQESQSEDVQDKLITTFDGYAKAYHNNKTQENNINLSIIIANISAISQYNIYKRIIVPKNLCKFETLLIKVLWQSDRRMRLLALIGLSFLDGPSVPKHIRRSTIETMIKPVVYKLSVSNGKYLFTPYELAYLVRISMIYPGIFNQPFISRLWDILIDITYGNKSDAVIDKTWQSECVYHLIRLLDIMHSNVVLLTVENVRTLIICANTAYIGADTKSQEKIVQTLTQFLFRMPQLTGQAIANVVIDIGFIDAIIKNRNSKLLSILPSLSLPSNFGATHPDAILCVLNGRYQTYQSILIRESPAYLALQLGTSATHPRITLDLNGIANNRFPSTPNWSQYISNIFAQFMNLLHDPYNGTGDMLLPNSLSDLMTLWQIANRLKINSIAMRCELSMYDRLSKIRVINGSDNINTVFSEYAEICHVMNCNPLSPFVQKCCAFIVTHFDIFIEKFDYLIWKDTIIILIDLCIKHM